MTKTHDESETQPVRETISVKTSTGPEIEGSREAIRRMTVLLEVLTGLRGPTEGAQVLGVNLTRYYQLETLGLQGIVSAMEPRPRGRRPRPAEERVAALEAELATLRQELCRAHALLRQAQRAIGLSEPAATRAPAKGRKKAKTRRGKPRAVKVIDKLKAEVPTE
jgi:hypothetical protein